MTITDCHTHHLNAENAIINVELENFYFKEEKLYSIGIHPWKAESASAGLISSLEELLQAHRNIVAIGETGIDKLISTPVAVQEQLFIEHIKLAEVYRKPIIVHCVRAWQEIIRLRLLTKASQPWIIHGFRGKPSILKDLLNQGFYISYGEKFNEQSLLATPASRLLIETDESSASIAEIAGKVAATLGTDRSEICEKVATTASLLFASK